MPLVNAGCKLSIALLAALLAIGLTACGSGDDSASTTTEASSQSGGGSGSSGGEGSSDEAGAKARKGRSGSDQGGGESGESGGGGSGNFVPKQHDDSGGGSEQFRVKGGDNSVQEFGEEADTSERDEAATTLHNFLDARSAEDWEAACSYLAADVRESLEKLAAQAKQVEDTSCAEILGKLTNRAALPALREEAARADVGSLRIEGGQAFVIYRGLGGTILAVPMANESGSWRVASLAGTPLN